MIALSRSWIGGSILNAIPTGVGSSFAVAIYLESRIEYSTSTTGSCRQDVDREILSNIAAEIAGARYGAIDLEKICVSVSSPVPHGYGLKTSSAYLNTLIISLAKYMGLDIGPIRVLGINVEISKRYGLSITGALDDAAASLTGAIVVSDNYRGRILKIIEPPRRLHALIIIPRYRRKYTFKEIEIELRKRSRYFSKAVEALLNGDLWEAMNINGDLVAEALKYDRKPIEMLRRWGAIAAGISGNGPAYIAVADEGVIDDLYSMAKERLGGDLKIIKTRLPGEPAEDSIKNLVLKDLEGRSVITKQKI